MGQSVRGSVLEAVANVAAGLVLGLLLQAGLHTLYGLRSTGPQQLSIVVAFTLASLLRSFALRRLFDRLGR